ncbi:hypothetical protein [Hongsoonwoonella zoysiae]|uniref:hypothetical protein n=1 Tax=Hongsoonwoonella zoysiae TaxID=2821844 RepID=UPI001FE80825|nr:hypothetical protein [Hongsoonwoonella zoysiae]
MFGNRGGRIHDPATKTLLPRRWASKQWICCVLSFEGRRRKVMGEGYTELFFLDEVTALAAGQRPCFECRRQDALRFAAAWARAFDLAVPPKALEMDKVLHEERLENRQKRLHQRDISGLPEGAVLRLDDVIYAVKGGKLLPWSFEGYGAPEPLPSSGLAEILTPPATLGALKSGYNPQWHESAG